MKGLECTSGIYPDSGESYCMTIKKKVKKKKKRHYNPWLLSSLGRGASLQEHCLQRPVVLRVKYQGLLKFQKP